MLTLNAINFGSGWFPTLRKRDGLSGYRTVEAGTAAPRAVERGASSRRSRPPRSRGVRPGSRARADGALRGRAARARRTASATSASARSSRSSAGRAARPCALPSGSRAGRRGTTCRATTASAVPFYKRAQIAAADLALAGSRRPRTSRRAHVFADNLVPHVLRLDGVLEFDERSCAPDRARPAARARLARGGRDPRLRAARRRAARRGPRRHDGDRGRQRALEPRRASPATRRARATGRARRLIDQHRAPGRRAVRRRRPVPPSRPPGHGRPRRAAVRTRRRQSRPAPGARRGTVASPGCGATVSPGTSAVGSRSAGRSVDRVYGRAAAARGSSGGGPGRIRGRPCTRTRRHALDDPSAR